MSKAVIPESNDFTLCSCSYSDLFKDLVGCTIDPRDLIGTAICSRDRVIGFVESVDPRKDRLTFAVEKAVVDSEIRGRIAKIKKIVFDF